MIIRKSVPQDEDSIWNILEPVIRSGETYPLPRDMTREAALAYWLAPEKQTFVAEIRCSVRRFTRLTNAFSKKAENLKAAVSLWFAYYNFCRIHGSLRVTPAMEAGIADRVWSLDEL